MTDETFEIFTFWIWMLIKICVGLILLRAILFAFHYNTLPLFDDVCGPLTFVAQNVYTFFAGLISSY